MKITKNDSSTDRNEHHFMIIKGQGGSNPSEAEGKNFSLKPPGREDVKKFVD